MKKIIPAFLFTVLYSAMFNLNAAEVSQSLECSEEEVSAYLDQSGFKKGKGFNTIPTTEEFIKAEIEKKKIEGDENTDDCITIFDEGIDMSKGKDKLQGIMDILNDPMGGLSSAGKKAKERMFEIYNSSQEQMSKGICERLSTESVTGAAGDQIGKIYKESTKDTVLYGTKVNPDEIFVNGGGFGGGINGGSTVDTSEVFGKNFTYKIIKNQIGKNSSSIARILDIGNPNQAGVIGNAVGDILDSNLDIIEDSIFGD